MLRTGTVVYILFNIYMEKILVHENNQKNTKSCTVHYQYLPLLNRY